MTCSLQLFSLFPRRRVAVSGSYCPSRLPVPLDPPSPRLLTADRQCYSMKEKRSYPFRFRCLPLCCLQLSTLVQTTVVKNKAPTFHPSHRSFSSAFSIPLRLASLSGPALHNQREQHCFLLVFVFYPLTCLPRILPRSAWHIPRFSCTSSVQQKV